MTKEVTIVIDEPIALHVGFKLSCMYIIYSEKAISHTAPSNATPITVPTTTMKAMMSRMKSILSVCAGVK